MKATTSCLFSISSRRYGRVRKKSRLKAEQSAVSTPAQRPPSSATTMVSARNTNVKLDAGVSSRNGVSAAPMKIAPAGPAAL